MEKEGLIKLKSGKDQDSVVGVDLKHASIQGHKQHVTVAESLIKDKKKAAREAAANGGAAPGSAEGARAGDEGAGPSVKKAKVRAVREVFKPSGSTLPFWAACRVRCVAVVPSSSPALGDSLTASAHAPHSPDSLLTAQEVRTHLQAYVTANTVVPRDQSVVYLDDTLKRAVLSKTEDGVIRLKKAEVEVRLRSKMTELFAVDRVGEEGVLKWVLAPLPELKYA